MTAPPPEESKSAHLLLGMIGLLLAALAYRSLTRFGPPGAGEEMLGALAVTAMLTAAIEWWSRRPR